MIEDQFGRKHPCRAVLDNGSQINILTQKMVKHLNLVCNKSNLPISAVNDTNIHASKWVKLVISSMHSNYRNSIGCHVLPTVTCPLPAQSINIDSWTFSDDVRNNLANPSFHKCSSVDMLLWAEIFYEVICSQPTVMPGGLPWLYNTTFGWIISGPVSTAQCYDETRSTSCFLVTSAWLGESLLNSSKAEEEVRCEHNFKTTHQRQDDGRFIVSLPFRDDAESLGRSMELSLNRFLSLERKFQRCPELCKEYCEFINEYLALGHMSPIVDPVLHTGDY